MKTKNNNEAIPCTLSGKISVRFPKKEGSLSSEKSKRDIDKGEKAVDENTKLVINSNILTAIKGVLAAYGTMNQEQYKHIVDTFYSSI